MKNILIVEDENFLILALKDNLIKDGFTVSIAKNGEQAIKKIKKIKPNIILLDILMPKSDGFFALKKIKKNLEWKSIPVIILSNIEEEKAIKKTMEMGANDYFIKSQHSIYEVIKKIESYFVLNNK